MKPQTTANPTITRATRFMYWMSGHWLQVALAVVFLYTALPFLAPTLMYVGARGPAKLIYTMYKPLCHQLAFRSWFVFGAQPVYPLAQAEVDGLETFQAYAIRDPDFRATFAAYEQQVTGFPMSADQVSAESLAPFTSALQLAARSFIGNAEMGYKVALCERDIAIYAAIFIGGLLFIPLRRRLRPVPLLLYLFLGLGPIALDGGSQLLSAPPLSLWPMRETRPLLRVLTGTLFGLMNAWLAFPYLELSMREMHQDLAAKIAHLIATAANPQAAREAARARLAAYTDAWPTEDGPNK